MTRHHALAYGLVDLALKLTLLFVGHVFCTTPVVLVETITFAFTITPVTILFLLLEYVEHLLGVHATESLVDQAHRFTRHLVPLGVARHGNQRLVRIEVSEHQVNHVVTSLIRQLVILVMQLLPCGQVSIHLVGCFVRNQEPKLLVTQLTHELASVLLITAIGTCGRDVIHYASTPNHQHARQ